MHSKSFLRTLPFLCLSLAAANAFAGEHVSTMRVDGEIEVGPGGQVNAHTLKTPVPADVRDIIERHVADWSFEAPVDTVTRNKMRITLSSRGEGDERVVGVDHVRFLAHDDAPRGRLVFDNANAKRHLFQASGALMMDVRLASDGRVLDVSPSQCTVWATRPGLSKSNACEDFERYAQQRLPRWQARYVPAAGETLPDGEWTGTFPMVFRYNAPGLPAAKPGQWRSEWRTAYKAAPWQDDGAQRIGASDIDADSGFTSEVGALRLRTD